MEDKAICIYHGNCADGFGAAWVVHKLLGYEGCDFHAGVYQSPPPDVTGKVVYMVDFSYKRGVLLEMAAQAKHIIILDHHKSAALDLIDLPYNVTTVFDMERSGAMITWDYFYPDVEVPQLLRHIQDRDLWQFKFPATREIQAALFSYPYDFSVWNDLMKPDAIPRLITDGVAIERKHFKDIKELLPIVTRMMRIGGVTVPVANLPYIHSSDAGHILSENESFAACYWDTPDGRVFSLRSSEMGMDVSEIAKKYGGGGHAHAAGFRIPFELLAQFEEELE